MNVNAWDRRIVEVFFVLLAMSCPKELGLQRFVRHLLFVKPEVLSTAQWLEARTDHDL